ncbi:MAG: BamA/TamA family outer membrane protein [Bacteroidaceae bacterium]|nr:BamA/TamA family outer membrane protein [Bacteroidaceae bacterium]
MIRHSIYKYVPCILAALMFVSCYQTKNIPDDEYLYAGIKELAYGHKWGEKKNRKDSTGVITAVANAYTAVQGVLTGNSSALESMKSHELTKHEKDSIKALIKQDAEAYSLAKSEVEGVLSYAPNGSLMGSSKYKHPFTVGLWIWNRYVNSNSRFGRWMMNSFASNPKYISSVAPAVRTQVARNTLQNYGYFNADVKFRIDSLRNPRKQKVSYQVLPGQLFRLDSIEYRGFTGAADSIIEANMDKRLLHSNDPFCLPTLSDERERITNLLRNNGYYYYHSDYIAYRADTVQKPLKVQLQVLPSASIPEIADKPYRIGKTHITVLKYNDTVMTDSFALRNITMRWSGGKVKRPPLRLSAMLRYLYQRKGDLYSQETQNLIQNQIAAMGIFSNLHLDYKPAQGDTLDLYINTMLDKPYDSEFEGKITNKTNGLLGPGLSYSINKRNAFRGAETLTWGINGSYEWQTGANNKGKGTGINSWELGSNITLSYPRFMFFGIGKRLNRKVRSTTLFKADVKWLNRAGYYSQISAGIRAKWTFQKSANILHEFTPIHLEYSQLLSTTDEFIEIMDQNPALYMSLKDQLVPSMEYKFTWTSPKVKRNINNLSLSTKQSYKFQKNTIEYTHSLRLGERSHLLTHGYLGFLWEYNGQTAPYQEMFTAGGANSIRAFGVRSIGPGSYNPVQSQFSYLNQIGSMKFECNLEYRFPIIGSLFGAVFVDAGNVWLLREDPDRPGGKFEWKNFGRELALGTGAGLRYDLDFLVIRFDIGVGIHAPYDTGKEGYYNMTSFGKSLGYHFAIGYPF